MFKKYRFGMIVPSTNLVIEPDFYSLALKEVGFYTSRVLLGDCIPEELKRMAGFAERAALELSTANVQVILFACTSGSLIEGLNWEKDLAEKIRKISKVPAITTSGCVKNALHFMKLSKISVFTPYIDEINKKEKEFLEKSGFEVLCIKGLGITNTVKIADVEPKLILDEAIQLYEKNKETQGIFISCTDLRTFDIINKLENQIGIPVITSNQASLWGLLTTAKIKTAVQGLGKLLSL